MEGEPSWPWRHTPTVQCTLLAQWTTCPEHRHTWNIHVHTKCLSFILFWSESLFWLYIWDYLLFDIVSPFWVYVLLLITFKWTLIICFRTPPLHKCNSADCRLLSGNSCKQFILWFVYWKGLQGATRDQICLLIIYVYLFCKISLVYPWTVLANWTREPRSNHIWAVPIAYLLQRVWKWPGQCPYLALHNRHRQSTLQGGKRPVRYPLHVTFLSYSLQRPQGAHTRRGGVPRSELV